MSPALSGVPRTKIVVSGCKQPDLRRLETTRFSPYSSAFCLTHFGGWYDCG